MLEPVSMSMFANANDMLKHLLAERDEMSTTLTTLSTRNTELEREVKRLREAQIWRGMDSAPRAGERILLAWKPVGGLSEHVELGKWKDRQGWSNTYGHAFSEAPDAWAPLAPFSTSPQGGEHA